MNFKPCKIKGRNLREQLLDLSERSQRKGIEIGASICEKDNGKQYLAPLCEGDSCNVFVCPECPHDDRVYGDVHTHPKVRWPLHSTYDLKDDLACPKNPLACVIAPETNLMSCIEKKDYKKGHAISRHMDYEDHKWLKAKVSDLVAEEGLDADDARDRVVDEFNAHGDKFGLQRELNEHIWNGLMDYKDEAWKKTFCLTRLGQE